MDEMTIFAALIGILALLFGLPIWALLRTRGTKQLERRVAGLEAALLRVMRGQASAAQATEPRPAQSAAEAQTSAPAPAPRPTAVAPSAEAPPDKKKLEELIGERWLSWVGISILLFGAVFFLKYAFENRWIGELGRVAIGMVAGLGFVGYGRRRHLARWRTFSQVFTAGGVTLMYLSIYASYAFYDLIPSWAAFCFLALVVIQAHLLAVYYNAPGIAVMGQIGGFLAPILLSTGRDQFAVLFSYVLLLDAGVVLVCLRKRWGWIASFSFTLSHALFWGWYVDHYHPEKLWPAVAFQAGVFALFLIADLLPIRRGRPIGLETWVRLLFNPFVFFASAYALLEPEHPQWMGVFAVLLAALYALIARWALGWSKTDRRPALIAVGVALLFVTMAIPIQLEANWITLAWGVQAVVLVWLAVRLRSDGLRLAAFAVAAPALFRQLVFDTPWDYRAAFTPLWNREFTSAFALAACFLAMAWLLRQERPGAAGREVWALALVALGLVWFTSTVEIYSYFEVQVRELAGADYAQRRALDWTAQMLVSVLWATFAAALVGTGLSRGLAALRWTGLALFGATVLKAIFIDITILEGIYRIAALMALGALLLGAGWGYQRMQASGKESEGAE